MLISISLVTDKRNNRLEEYQDLDRKNETRSRSVGTLLRWDLAFLCSKDLFNPSIAGFWHPYYTT